MTNSNQLTQIQEEAIQEAILESMRVSFQRSNKTFDPNFEKASIAVAKSVIALTKKILDKKEVQTKKNARR